MLRKLATLGLVAVISFTLAACDECTTDESGTTGETPACCPAPGDDGAATGAPAAAAATEAAGSECDACPSSFAAFEVDNDAAAADGCKLEKAECGDMPECGEKTECGDMPECGEKTDCGEKTECGEKTDCEKPTEEPSKAQD